MPWEDGLDDFEKQLAAEKGERDKKERHSDRHDKHSHRHRDDRKKHHHHHHRSHKDRDHDKDEHRSKRRRHDSDYREDREERGSHKHHGQRSSTADQALQESSTARPDLTDVKRDSWMEAPSAFDVEHVQRKRKEASPPKQGTLGQEFEMKLHEKELNHHLKDLQNGRELDELEDEEAQHEGDYTFGDRGSSWRMTRLKAVYRQAEESGRPVEEVAMERYGSLRKYDDAREEEIELDRRDTYGKDYVGKEKPSGDLFQERKLDSGIRSTHKQKLDPPSDDEFDNILENVSAPAPTAPSQPKFDQTTINKLKAQLMKAELRKDPKVNELRAQYEAAIAGSTSSDPTIIHLSAMDNRMLSSAPRNEVKPITNRRGQERGNVEANEDMTIEDMIAEERRTKTQSGGESQRYAERIAKDSKFDNSLDYLDENATKLSKRVHKSDANLRNMTINEYQKLNTILENCPLCHHEDAANAADQLPTAPIVSLGTRVYLTLPTRPELAPYSAMIVPIQHHTNTLHCDDDEWEEIRNFMKCLTRSYHSRDRDVLFYENAAFPARKGHAGIVAVPLPQSVGETASAFWREAFLSQEREWSQHRKVIDTLGGGGGRGAFRRSLAKEMPYVHVWFGIDGGMGHVVEEGERWPRGDLFAREVVGGMLGLEGETIRKQERWHRGGDKERVEGFRKRWNKFDWTRVLVEGQQ
ncbi:Pre-mRNA-splicing factor cwf19 [Knufia fluminis]|uniref:Pre-mRNA-splicing factor cwf19 n=1 Tax=Knufia fluminis TaxID=191047 RepID=A0AAN8EL09_9EURO|nr:Pre-mRNA-splicing factor cwf19 [Knufia fluminis]